MKLHRPTSERVIECIAESLVREPGEITPCQLLREDLGCDSLDIVEIQLALEDEFDTAYDDAELGKCHYVADLIGVCGGALANVRGLSCPECGNDQMLRIEGTAIFSLKGETFEDPEEITISEDGFAGCPNCDWEGTYHKLK